MESENVGNPGEVVDEMITKLNEVTGRIREEVRPKGNGEVGRRGWWHEECKKNKDRAEECVSKWRKGEMEKGECKWRRREHERILSERRQGEMERYKKKVEKAVKEGRE